MNITTIARRAVASGLLVLAVIASLAVTATPASADTTISGFQWIGTPSVGATMTVSIGDVGDLGDMLSLISVYACDTAVNGPSSHCSDVYGLHYQVGATTFVVPDVPGQYLIAGYTVMMPPIGTQVISPGYGPILPRMGPPAIRGGAGVTNVLTADAGVWEHMTGTFAYEWFACYADCASLGVTGEFYEVPRSLEGATIKVAVTAEVDGVTHTVFSAPTGIVPLAVPVAVNPTGVSGPAVDGASLHATPGTWTGVAPLSYEYRWLSCPAATPAGCDEVGDGPDYDVDGSDVGHHLIAAVTATNDYGTQVSFSDPHLVAAQLPVLAVAATFSGPPVIGTPVELTPAVFAGTGPLTTSWVWQRCANSLCVDVPGSANSRSFMPQGSDRDAQITVVTTAMSPYATATAVAAAGVVTSPPPPAATVLPSLTGTVAVGQTLTGSSGSWVGGHSFVYSWARCDRDLLSCEGIDNVSATYTITAGDVGQRLVFTTTATGLGGTTALEVATAVVGVTATGPVAVTPVVTGPARSGQTLTATLADWSVPASQFAWRWQRCDRAGAHCVDIDEGTEATYTLSGADVGATVRVLVTVTSPTANAMGASAAGPVIVAAPVVGVVGVDGAENAPGQTITVTGSGFGPHSTVTVVLHPDAVELGTVTADAAGAFIATFTVPAGVPAGDHHLVLSGVDAGGNPVTLTRAIIVPASSPGPPSGPDAPPPPAVVAHPPAVGVTPSPAASDPGGLPRTGSSSGVPVAVALALVVGGLALVAGARRRSQPGV